MWDYETKENVLSLDWNPAGSLLGLTTKDKTVSVVDPRSLEESSRLNTLAHEGIKTHKMTWLDDEHLATTGYSKRNEREIKTFDIRNFTAP